MSLLPMDTIRAYRKNIDVTIQTYGIPCILYIPKNIEQQRELDIYHEEPDTQYYDSFETKTFIEWNPSTKRLRNLGIFVEDEIPIVAWFRIDHMLKRGSYIKIMMNYDVSDNQFEEFELVDQLIRNAYDSTVVEAWRIAPRRRK